MKSEYSALWLFASLFLTPVASVQTGVGCTGGAHGGFGSFVCIDGDRIAVGARGAGGGSAYVFAIAVPPGEAIQDITTQVVGLVIVGEPVRRSR